MSSCKLPSLIQGLRRASTATSAAVARGEKSWNQITLIGRLGQEPQLRNNNFITFSLATNRSYADADGGLVKQTDWFNVAVSRPDLVQVTKEMLKKGSRVHVVGEMQQRTYTNQSGVEVQTYSVVPNDITLLST